jgi:hypothetical protein
MSDMIVGNCRKIAPKKTASKLLKTMSKSDEIFSKINR